MSTGNVNADRPLRWLKWENDTIGVIDEYNNVNFTKPQYNSVVELYTRGATHWSPYRFIEFVSERVVSRERRDIEKILFRCGLSEYNVVDIGVITRAIHPKDMIWIANDENERFESVITDVFNSVFYQHTDLVGDSIDTPEGNNIKRYGAYNGKYGIYKERLNPLSTDVESEVAVYRLAMLFGVPCCPVYRTDKDTVFSEFQYDFSMEYIAHFRRLFQGARSENEYRNLISVRPQYSDAIAQMILLDFITRQDDRHLSNMAIKLSGDGETFYPLYDNGRSLFYEDTEELVKLAASDPASYATTFGYSGSYYDYIREISTERADIKSLMRIDRHEAEIAAVLRESGFVGYRYYGALEWILRSLELISSL